jgi:hypothetical protein
MPFCCDRDCSAGQKDAVKLQGTHAMKKSLEVIRKVCGAASYMYCGKYEVSSDGLPHEATCVMSCLLI